MIYKFKSKATADVIMLGPNGDQVLRVLGREPSPKGILEVDAMPAAMAALQKAIADEEASTRGEADQDDEGDADEKAPTTVSLRQRAWPLLEMIRQSHAAGEPIVWGV